MAKKSIKFFMKNTEKTTQKLSEKKIKKNLLSFVMGGEMDLDRCNEAGSKYADSIYVKRPAEQKPVIKK